MPQTNTKTMTKTFRGPLKVKLAVVAMFNRGKRLASMWFWRPHDASFQYDCGERCVFVVLTTTYICAARSVKLLYFSLLYFCILSKCPSKRNLVPLKKKIFGHQCFIWLARYMFA